MTTPYLIAHVVRGQPAFDIAIRCDDMGTPTDPGPWWIVPTSGHRAYPYWSTSLEGVLQGELCVSLTDSWLAHKLANPPEGWPDHYSVNDCNHIALIDEITEDAKAAAPPGTGTITATDLLTKLGLAKPKEPFKRRI